MWSTFSIVVLLYFNFVIFYNLQFYYHLIMVLITINFWFCIFRFKQNQKQYFIIQIAIEFSLQFQKLSIFLMDIKDSNIQFTHLQLPLFQLVYYCCNTQMQDNTQYLKNTGKIFQLLDANI
ncbi:hypothetical protein FGO68_gene16936 [Halteria grandinella]|uniref:Transmembrane protein n=1 Tax=Halteria grandinella TaxID=5974 RepID=A0A8J8NEW6_HALGN|nr:hypothetical protein FGO68_gene16936 [Halteria grandinella]